MLGVDAYIDFTLNYIYFPIDMRKSWYSLMKGKFSGFFRTIMDKKM